MPPVAVRMLWSIAIATCLPCVAMGEDWPQWRGPQFHGVSSSTGVAQRWSSGENIAWRQPMPGPAGSTPIVAAGHVYVTSVSPSDSADALVLLAYRATDGELLWQRAISKGNSTARGDEGNSASPSPVADSQRVIALFGDGVLACFDHDGEQVWKLNLQDRYGKLNIQFGYSSSPLLFRDRVYVQWIHGDGDPKTPEARVICIDAATGVEAWQRERLTGARAENEHSYASPTLCRQRDQEPLLLTHGGDYLIAHTLDGEEVWRLGGLNPEGAYNPFLRFVASPVVGPGLIVAPSAKRGSVIGLRAGGHGDLTQGDQIAWTLEGAAPDVSSPLIDGGLLYICREDGVVSCFDTSTGKRLYRERLQSDRYRASPVVADGKLYFTSRSGVVSVVRAGDKFQLLAENDLGEDISSSPAIADGVLYLRTFSALYAIKE